MSNTYTWTLTSAPTTYEWVTVSTVFTGQYLAASDLSNNIYISSDFGQTWTVTSSLTATMPLSICSSSNGQYIYASGTGIEYSTNYGQTWTQAVVPTSNSFVSICCDVTGKYIYAGNIALGIYSSSNYGQTWTATAAPTIFNWVGICCSDNGQYISVLGNYRITYNTSYIYYSADNGSTWTQSTTSLTNNIFNGICCDSTGSISFATYNGGIFKTTNQWLTSTSVSVPSANWSSICCNYNATIIAAAINSSGSIWVSTDSGTTWAQSVALTGQITRIRSDQLGNNLVAVGIGGIYVGTANPFYELTYNNSITVSLTNNVFAPTNSLALSNYGTYITEYPSFGNNYYLLKPFGVSSGSTYYYSSAASTNYLINGTDLSTLVCPIYTLWTTGTNITAYTYPSCTGILAVLVGSGGGGGSSSATSGGYGLPGGGGGGGAIGSVYIPNPSLGTAMAYTFTVGVGGAGAAARTGGSGDGNSGSSGTPTTFTFSAVTYNANGGGGGGKGTTSNTGSGGTGGTVSITGSGSWTESYSGNAGSDGMAKYTDTPTTTMGGLGGFSGNFAITSGPPPSPGDTNPTQSIPYNPVMYTNGATSSAFVWDPNNSLAGTSRIINQNVISSICQTGLVQNGSGFVSSNYHNYTSPYIGPYPGYFGQGGFGGDSDTNTSGYYGWAGLAGQPGAVYVFQFFGAK